jgi:YD repeat-containing protein
MSDGTASINAYNPFDTPLSSTDRLGRVTNSTFDVKGNLLSKTRAVASSEETTETYLYNAQGLVTEHRDALYDANFPELHNTRYEYDANNYPTKVIYSADVAGGTRPEALYTWDSTGRLSSTTDANGRVINYAYDVRSRLITTTYNDTSTEIVTYGTGNDASIKSHTTRPGHLA